MYILVYFMFVKFEYPVTYDSEQVQWSDKSFTDMIILQLTLISSMLDFLE